MREGTRTIAVANQKGGAGKTTTVVNLGFALAQMQKRVLAVDLDPQGALSAGLGIDGHGLQETVYTALMDGDFPTNRVIYPVKAYLDLLPANIDLASAEIELMSRAQRELHLQHLLEPMQSWYDYILIDCPPSLGLLTLNALAASREALVPMQCEYFALRGIRPLFEALEHVRKHHNPELDLGGILVTMYSADNVHSREVRDQIRAIFADQVYDVVIPKSIRFAEASVANQSILEYAAYHRGAEAYRTLAQRIASSEEKDTPTRVPNAS